MAAPSPRRPSASRRWRCGLIARQKEKRAIARAAVALARPGRTLFLDAGSTTSILAEEIATLSGMTVITNSLAIAPKLAGADEGRAARNEVRLLGGAIDVKTQATHGEGTLEDIRRFRADVALLSPVGLHPKHGAMSFEHHEAAVARAMSEQAQQVVILADHSKIGQASRPDLRPQRRHRHRRHGRQGARGGRARRAAQGVSARDRRLRQGYSPSGPKDHIFV